MTQGKLRRLMWKLLPWAPRTHRREAIADAEVQKMASQHAAEEAKTAERRLQDAMRRNHIAQYIAQQIRGNR